jgi:hypothetical protein
VPQGKNYAQVLEKQWSLNKKNENSSKKMNENQ